MSLQKRLNFDFDLNGPSMNIFLREYENNIANTNENRNIPKHSLI